VQTSSKCASSRSWPMLSSMPTRSNRPMNLRKSGRLVDKIVLLALSPRDELKWHDAFARSTHPLLPSDPIWPLFSLLTRLPLR